MNALPDVPDAPEPLQIARPMHDEITPDRRFVAPVRYELKLQGHLGEQWSGWFDGAAITLQDNGDTVLVCAVRDQAALHGLIKKVRDLGMPLISVIYIQPCS